MSTRSQATLYDPRSCTRQVSTASRPTGTVALMIAALNLGSGTGRGEREKELKVNK